ncbi:MAG TPA: TetR/AcrR family transcriptional regulator [Polyangiaceae bacterium]|nr:TetR/AcrR family transcriptional regulator [Polyangiaceae bacterium]
MRYPDGHSDEVRARIVEAASRSLRRDGLDGVSIPKLMKAVGLTHGGFYVHFKDRDELVAAAIAHAAGESAFAAGATKEAAFARYLSPDHVGHPEFGCVIAALGEEGARQTGRVGRAFAEAARGLLRSVDRRLHPRSQRETPSDEALQKASQAVGAVVLARLIQDDELAARLLAVAKANAVR